MKYYIAITKGTNIKIIDLNLTDIKKLDEFTSEFNNEIELKKYLIQKNKIDELDFAKKIEIVHTFNQKIFRAPIIYKSTKKYLDRNLKYCIEVLVNDDIEFLEAYIKLLQKDRSIIYKNMYQSICDLKTFIKDYYSDNIYNDSYAMKNEALNDIFDKYAYSKTGKINYNNCRKLAVLIDEYTKSRLKKKQETIDGEQLQIFNDDIEDDYEEPLFPSNSEEEAMYNKYLESLNQDTNIEDHDHYRRM